jgi:hypothetical protein
MKNPPNLLDKLVPDFVPSFVSSRAIPSPLGPFSATAPELVAKMPIIIGLL